MEIKTTVQIFRMCKEDGETPFNTKWVRVDDINGEICHLLELGSNMPSGEDVKDKVYIGLVQLSKKLKGG